MVCVESEVALNYVVWLPKEVCVLEGKITSLVCVDCNM